MDTTEFKRFIEILAEESGKIIAPLFRNPNLKVELKADQSVVTIADRSAEERLRLLIKRRYPEHGIVGEEFGAEDQQAEFVWVLDPIDGTISFTSGCPLFGTLIGLLHQGRPLLGAIHQPILGQLCLGDTQATFLNGSAVRIRSGLKLEQATLLVSDPCAPAKYKDGTAFERLTRQVNIYRSWGDCYGYLLLSGGYADIMCDPIMNPWDLLPVIPIIEGAGGVVTSWEGADAATADSCVAAGKDLHPQVLKLLKGSSCSSIDL